MVDVLADLVAHKRREVADRLGGRRIDAVRTNRSLHDALARPGTRFIMEVKRASPSGHRARHSPDDAVSAYAGVADAISVLVDAKGFGGSLDDLRAVRARFDGPILAEDFTVDAAQLAVALADPTPPHDAAGGGRPPAAERCGGLPHASHDREREPRADRTGPQQSPRCDAHGSG